MNQAEFKLLMEVHGDRTCEDTCDKLVAEIVRKIMNCKAIDDFGKVSILRQYIGNHVTNITVVEGIKNFNKRT